MKTEKPTGETKKQKQPAVPAWEAVIVACLLPVAGRLLLVWGNLFQGMVKTALSSSSSDEILDFIIPLILIGLFGYFLLSLIVRSCSNLLQQPENQAHILFSLILAAGSLVYLGILCSTHYKSYPSGVNIELIHTGDWFIITLMVFLAIVYGVNYGNQAREPSIDPTANLVTIADLSTKSEWEASILVSRLEEEGIKATVEGGQPSMFGTRNTAEVRLVVREEDQEEAQKILSTLDKDDA